MWRGAWRERIACRRRHRGWPAVQHHGYFWQDADGGHHDPGAGSERSGETLHTVNYRWQRRLLVCVQFFLADLNFGLVISVPATRLVKGQGAKEIRHNLACERHKIGHSLERERPKFCHNPARKLGTILCGWKRAQICKHFTSIFTSVVWKYKNRKYIFLFFFLFGKGAVWIRQGAARTEICLAGTLSNYV